MQPRYLRSVGARRNPHEMPSRSKQVCAPAASRLLPRAPRRFPGAGCPRVLWASRGDAGWSMVVAPRPLKRLPPHLCRSSLFSRAFPTFWQFTFGVSRPPLRAPEGPGCHLTSGFPSDALGGEERLVCWCFGGRVLRVCTFQGQAASFPNSLGLFTYGNQDKFTQTVV